MDDLSRTLEDLTGADRAAIEALVGAPVVLLALVDWRMETRLRFNAPTPVEAWRLKAIVRTGEGADYPGEIELFRWVVDGEWELVSV